MKISKEDEKFLLDLSRKMKKQNNRATQFPMFVIKQKVKVYGDSSWCSEVERKEEFDLEDYNGNSNLCEKCEKIYEEQGAFSELPDYCEECDSDIYVWFNWEDETVEDCGSFFLAEEAQKHIDANDYHYHKPFVYGIPSWRNYDTQRVLTILAGLEGEVPNYYR